MRALCYPGAKSLSSSRKMPVITYVTLMEALMVERGRMVSRDRLLDEIWGITWTDSKTFDQHIRRLRRKLEQAEGAPCIEIVRGVGYRLDV